MEQPVKTIFFFSGLGCHGWKSCFLIVLPMHRGLCLHCVPLPSPGRMAVLSARLPVSLEIAVARETGLPCCPNHGSEDSFQME